MWKEYLFLVFVGIETVLVFYSVWLVCKANKVQDVDTKRSLKIWKARMKRYHVVAFVLTMSFVAYFLITEASRDELTLAQGEGCLNETVSSKSGYSQAEMCEFSLEALDQFEVDSSSALKFFESHLASDVKLSLSPRGILPEFLLGDCVNGRENLLSNLETLFELSGEESPFERVETNATSASSISVSSRLYSLGVTFYIHMTCEFVASKISILRIGCCDPDSLPLVVDTC